MILKVALRSLSAHPVRSLVLACGFGTGVAVMATLLGVGEVILVQSRSPALRGGGDVIVAGATGRLSYARYLLSSVLGVPPLKDRVVAASPTTHALLYLVRDGRVSPIRARGGIPTLERALGDPEASTVASWADAPADASWAAADPADALQSMDRFHPIPDVPGRAASWAEWLYFNGRSGDTRFYLTFLVGPDGASGRRTAGVRLQLDRGGRFTSYAEGEEIEAARVLAEAPALAVRKSHVRLEHLRYRLTLDLPEERRGSGASAPGHVSGELFLEAVPGRSMPPFMIRGVGGWVSGYVVPVMSGRLGGWLVVDGKRIALDDGVGYHDHNWGFWEGVSWQWGQVQQGGLSFLYGRVHPPADAADPERIPGFLVALGPNGPVGYSADVSILETFDPETHRPQRIVVQGRGQSLDLKMELGVEDARVTDIPRGPSGGGMLFYQLRARYRVRGEAGGQRIDFEAPGSAETFRGR
jgi:hypothetical protein